MDYNVTLLIFGILLLLTGLIGKIKAKELEIGTESAVIRAVVGLIGVGLVVLSLMLSPAGELFNRKGSGGGTGDGGSTGHATTEVTKVIVPDIVGGSADAARTALEARGLKLGRRTGTQETDRIAAGNIVSQDPAARRSVDPGTAVNFETAVRPPAPAIDEDCLRFDLSQLQAREVGGRWKITQGDRWLLDFASDGTSARRALEVLTAYRADRICYVERPSPPMMYILSGDRPPDRSLDGEDCIGFDPGSLEIRREGSQFLLASSRSRMILFPDRASAEKAVAVIGKYGFTRQCFVGRPSPDFKYFRR